MSDKLNEFPRGQTERLSRRNYGPPPDDTPKPETPVIEPWILDTSRSITRLNTNDPERIAQSIAWYYATERARLRRLFQAKVAIWRQFGSRGSDVDIVQAQMNGWMQCADELDALIDRELPEQKETKG